MTTLSPNTIPISTMSEYYHDTEVPTCPECDGSLAFDFPFGELQCMDCDRPYTPEDVPWRSSTDGGSDE